MSSKKKTIIIIIVLLLGYIGSLYFFARRGADPNLRSFDRARESVIESSSINRKNTEEQLKLAKSVRNLISENNDLRKSIGELRESASGIKSAITSSQSISKNIGEELDSIEGDLERIIEINRTIKKRVPKPSN